MFRDQLVLIHCLCLARFVSVNCVILRAGSSLGSNDNVKFVDDAVVVWLDFVNLLTALTYSNTLDSIAEPSADACSNCGLPFKTYAVSKCRVDVWLLCEDVGGFNIRVKLLSICISQASDRQCGLLWCMFVRFLLVF